MGVPLRPKRANAALAAANQRVRIFGVEITQAIQNMSNQVPLIQGKATLVRVYVDCAALPATAQLRGELTIAQVAGAPAQYVASTNTVAGTAGKAADLATMRKTIDASLNFVLPLASLKWPHIVVSVGQLATAAGPVAFDTPDPITVDLVSAPPLRIRAVGLRYLWNKPDGTSDNVSPEAVHFDYLHSFLRRAYPVAKVEWSQIVVQANPLFTPPFSGPTSPDGDDVLWRSKLDLAHNQLSAIRAKDVSAGVDPRTHYYGLVSDASAGLFFRGAAKDVPQQPNPSVVAVGPAGDPSLYASLKWDRDRSYADWYGTHELSHTFGRFHPGFCGQDASDATFPYPDGRIGDDTHGDMVGVDLGDSALAIPMLAMSNDTCHDIMTYCDNQWISSYSYQAILARLRQEDAQFAPTA